MTRARNSIVRSLRPALFLAVAVTGLAVPASADFIKQTNLVSDDTTITPAMLQDPALKNPWGVAFSASGPMWVSDNVTGVATIYSINPATNAPTKLGLTVTIPGDGSVTGQAFNSGAGSGAFNGDAFLFVNQDGTVSGWRGALGTAAEVLQAGSASNVYTGTTFGSTGGHSYLYSANFKAGTIDVMKGDAGAPNLTGTFSDPSLPAGYMPFNVQNVGGTIYVAYAVMDPGTGEEMAGAGLGIVNAFDANGNLIGRVGSNGTLNAPWGIALAPMDFGEFAGDLLVGNFGDGTINAYDLATMTFEGQLKDMSGNVISIDELWAIAVGNGGSSGNTHSIYFTAGPNDEVNGLLGVLTFVPEPISILLFGSGLLGLGLRRRWATAT